MFLDFNGLPEDARTEFYQHDANWSNRMVLGDSLQVMASLAEREGMRGKVQCIYIDPPYGIKFNSNFQWSTTSRDVKDGKAEHITREPEQVKAFRDTWRDGIHSYLSYLRDRLTAARALLTESGSVFVQISDKNVHRVRMLMDEVFGDENFVSLITYRTSSGTTQEKSVKRVSDYIIWYCRNSNSIKFRRMTETATVNTKMYNQLELKDGITRRPMTREERADPSKCPKGSRPYQKLPVHSMASGDHEPRDLFKSVWSIPPTSHWRYAPDGFERLYRSSRIQPDKTALRAVYFRSDYPVSEISNSWSDTGPEIEKSYVVQTSVNPVARCILMATDPGDLVLDPTCGSGTTAWVAEQWGRRWITIDTSRVALALARARIMGAQYPWYLLADSKEGRQKEAKITGQPTPETPTGNRIKQGFVYERVPHITLESIANNAEIDVIWECWQERLESLRSKLNKLLGETWEEWEIPREAGKDWPADARAAHGEWWDKRITRQKQIDASIASNADTELLYDKPFEDKSRIRVAGPFTVESLTPHRVLPAEEGGKPLPAQATERPPPHGETAQFARMIQEHLKTAGVQQAHKEDRIEFTSIEHWPGKYVSFEGIYEESGGRQRRAGVFIGPEFGTVTRPDLAAAGREAAEAGFDVLIACAFNYDAQASELRNLGQTPILKARMNADLHMAVDLRNTGKGNLFVIFGEPDIAIETGDKTDEIRVRVRGVDVYDPAKDAIRSDDTDRIACWFIDTDYNEESFFVRHAYFLGANDSYKALKRTLKAEIDEDAWESLHSDVSRSFPKPASGRIAVKVINHFGDEVMKVFRT